VLLNEYERWTGDRALVHEPEFEARAALKWIVEYADLQHNGYIATSAATSRPVLRTSVWKDSWDSISYRDGTLPGFRRATCRATGLCL
jgi:glycogen debranching enzyme